ncbi:Di-glucose-binding within endoplasmic reticulum protein (macronuclear) [Tetrahymena thermophila SB210]|uniref:Di-glucose-binding within endoplasmic reticulum protein n=1 Tax=Tetrahymena thermophila (strain SB210) TaxID=312017 RepID=Q231X5_TETTS|nr:Di-glucose-binding within endoplasmic reticulum protein [Tetrahymena thermophila SB210]EAR91325.2 Di-glucose-binding within endoplasmic reticulum protein [Tetrahymena thermophila SB210]|eukprot:XP_001011570.2 Di-glucose-binding within endoplasmic reticulum protein [Tetrahymena thermophila SB210]
MQFRIQGILKAILCGYVFTLSQVMAFLPKEEKILAINCGENKFYKDTSSKILYKPDTFRDGGQVARREDVRFQQRKTIFDEIYDWNIHRTYVYDQKAFSYLLPLKRSGEYSLIMIFAEINDIGAKKRVFNIIVEDEVVIPNFDIYTLAGGKQLPHFEIIEFSFQNRVLKNKSKDNVIKTYNATYQSLNVTFESIRGSAKLDAIILYEGTFQDIKKNMVELFMDKSNNGEGLKMNQLRIFLQGNQITCQSDKDYIFPMRQYFIKKINEQQMQTCSQNINSQYSSAPQQNKIQNDQQEIVDKRKLTSQQIHNIRKPPAKRYQEIIEQIKETAQNFSQYIANNLIFFSCLFVHYLVICFLFRDKNKDKGNKNSKQQLTFKQMISQANLLQQQQQYQQQQQQLLQSQMLQKINQNSNQDQQDEAQ